MSDTPSKTPATRGSVTDSAWFWVMLFSCVSLVALQLVDWKYNRRQAQLERQFQGRQWASQHGAQVQMNPREETVRRIPVPVIAREKRGPVANAATPHAAPAGPTYSQPGQLVISLWPLRGLAVAALLVSTVLLWRENRQAVSTAEKHAP